MKQIIKSILLILVIVSINNIYGSEYFQKLSSTQEVMEPILNDIGYTETERQRICGTLDFNELAIVLESIFEKGKAAVDAEKTSLVEAMLITLYIPDPVLNINGYFDHFCKEYVDNLKFKDGMIEFITKITLNGRSLYTQLLEYFSKKYGDTDIKSSIEKLYS